MQGEAMRQQQESQRQQQMIQQQQMEIRQEPDMRQNGSERGRRGRDARGYGGRQD
jgi:hypothetical protein